VCKLNVKYNYKQQLFELDGLFELEKERWDNDFLHFVRAILFSSEAVIFGSGATQIENLVKLMISKVVKNPNAVDSIKREYNFLAIESSGNEIVKSTSIL
jgi:hypothetical protein